MTPPPSRFRALALVLLAGYGFDRWFQDSQPSLGLLPSASAQTADPAPSAAPALPADQLSPIIATPGTTPALAADAARTDATGHHLAPHDTFYLLTYVSVQTDKGVEGFPPGQEVHLVEVHRPTHTLVVSDGHAQVEVPPAALTHDLDIAARVRQKDAANQAAVAAYVQAEQVAYNKAERVAADFTARDLADHREQQREQAAEIRAQEQKPVARIATPAPASSDDFDHGYYGNGGYGYGSPYAYFVTNAGGRGSGALRTAPAAASTVGKGAAPAGQAGTARVK